MSHSGPLYHSQTPGGFVAIIVVPISAVVVNFAGQKFEIAISAYKMGYFSRFSEPRELSCFQNHRSLRMSWIVPIFWFSSPDEGAVNREVRRDRLFSEESYFRYPSVQYSQLAPCCVSLVLQRMCLRLSPRCGRGYHFPP